MASKYHLHLHSDVTVDVSRAVAMARLAEQVDLPIESLDEDAVNGFIISGDLLPDWYDDWVMVERERLRQIRLHALELLSEREATAGRFTLAVQAALAAVATEPLRDSAHRVLLAAYIREGNRGEAVRHYAVYSQLMRTELGGSPAIKLDEILEGQDTLPRVY